MPSYRPIMVTLECPSMQHDALGVETFCSSKKIGKLEFSNWKTGVLDGFLDGFRWLWTVEIGAELFLRPGMSLGVEPQLVKGWSADPWVNLSEPTKLSKRSDQCGNLDFRAEMSQDVFRYP